MKIKFTLAIVIAFMFSTAIKAQTYSPNVSKDSLSVLKDTQIVLKASLKIIELKIKESEEEADVEKLRIKLLKANEKAQESAAKNDETVKNLSTSTLSAKEIEKIAKRAKDDMSDSQRILESYNKQIKRVETIRSDIRIEEGILNGKRPRIIFEQK